MKNLTRIILVGIVIAVLAALAIPVAAQDAEPGSGDPLILPNFGADPTTFNPFLSNDGTSSTIWTRMYPSFLATDPDIGYFVPGARGAIVADWSVSEDGLSYTFTLRDDYTWSDGTPITSADIAYAWEVIQDETVENGGNMIDLRDKVASIETPDASTVVVTFNDPNCNSLDLAAGIPVVPSHVWREQFPTNSDMNGADYNLAPEVTGGVYNFLNYRPGEQVTLVANPAYPDGYAGAVIPEGFIYKNVADQTVQSEQFLAGQLTYMGVPSARQQELLDLGKAGEYHYHESTRANTRFVALNLADRSNPQPGLDENGEIIDQGMHPVLGDVRVRQALNYAINYEELNSGAFNGFGIQGATHSRPDDWAYDPTITPYPFDQEQAAALLDEAGWTDSDGDGVRECNGCLYATEVDPEFEGSPLAFQLLTNAGNTSQEALGTLLQDQWGEVGFDIDFQAIDFGVLVEQFTAQDFDAVMIFWGFGFPFDPDGIDAVFGSGNDTPGEGFNAVSYNNARLNEILDTARALPGCDIDERRTLYQEAYRMLHEDSPWIWIGIGQTLAVAQPWVEGWDPKPTASLEALYNEDAWIVDAP